MSKRLYNVKKVVTGLLAGTTLISSLAFPVNSYAVSPTKTDVPSQQKSVGNHQLTELDHLIASKYIVFNSSLKEFTVNPSIKKALPLRKVRLINDQVKETNHQLTLAKKESNLDAYAVSPNGKENLIKASLFRKNGVNSIKYYWNYARIKISAGSLNYALRAGFAIGTVYAPVKIIKLACSLVGIGINKPIKHGIWFDYNYYYGIGILNAGIQ